MTKQQERHLDNPTMFGKFSPEFFNRATKALELAAPVTEHIVSLITTSTNSGEKVDVSERAVFPFNEQAFFDANVVYQTLTRWTIHWAGRIGVPAPKATRGAWRQKDGTVIGLPADVQPVTASRIVGQSAGWLSLRLKVICQFDTETVLTFGDEIAEVFTIDARWPRKEHAKYADVPCMCEYRGRIAIYPPRHPGDDRKYVCESCGRWFRPEEFETVARAFEQHKAEIAKEYRQAQKVMKHLTAKYR